MEELRNEFGWYGIAHIATTQLCGIVGVLAVRVSCLNHECLDDAVEEGRVIYTFLGEFDEIVAVFRSFVIQFHNDVAHCGFDFHLSTFFHIV